MSVRRLGIAAALLLPLVIAGCVATGGYGVGYYQPAGITYGGWGANYTVGPVWNRGVYVPPRVVPHRAYRPVPVRRPIPSIPSRGFERRPAGPAHPAGRGRFGGGRQGGPSFHR